MQNLTLNLASGIPKLIVTQRNINAEIIGFERSSNVQDCLCRVRFFKRAVSSDHCFRWPFSNEERSDFREEWRSAEVWAL